MSLCICTLNHHVGHFIYIYNVPHLGECCAKLYELDGPRIFDQQQMYIVVRQKSFLGDGRNMLIFVPIAFGY